MRITYKRITLCGIGYKSSEIWWSDNVLMFIEIEIVLRMMGVGEKRLLF